MFDAAHPVRSRGELFGRDKEVDQLLSGLLDFQQHIIVHGARGSGKTSLVRIVGDHADQSGVVVVYLACEAGASFAELMHPYLLSLPTAVLAPEERDSFRRELAALPANFGPRAFVDLVADRVVRPVVFILDEFDRIEDELVKADIASAMKLLSDALSSILFVIVGIARSVSDVVGAHPSLRRHMRAYTIGRIAPASVDAFIESGELAAGMHFDAEARRMIVRAACGSPYHVRVFCHHAALVTLAGGGDTVIAADVSTGLMSAFEGWSRMNEPDAKLFAAVAVGGSADWRTAIEAFVRTAAVDDVVEVSGGNGPVFDLLRPVLEPAEGEPGFWKFNDSLAPQYLIALMMTTEKAAARAWRTHLEDTPHAVAG